MMEYNEKRVWKTLAYVGTGFMVVCMVISIFQFFLEKKTEPSLIIRYVSLFINATALVCFIYLSFNPFHFRAYSILLYVYGIGNIIDNGNILGMLCVLTSCAFLYVTDFFRKKRVPKIVLLSIPPLVSLISQYFHSSKVVFAISVMHIAGAVFITSIAVLLFYPRLKELDMHRNEYFLSLKDFSERDLLWLQKVLEGERYQTIADISKVSESTVKCHMPELYKKLNVADKTEFLTLYHNTKFILSVNADSVANKITQPKKAL